MPVIVIDSSIALQWVLPEPGAEQAYRYVKADGVISPDILLVEAANVLAKKVRAKDMSGDESMRALAMVRAGVRELAPSEPLVPRALELSIALSHPVYDCVFLACAEQVAGHLATRDAPFVKRASERGFGHLLLDAAP
ncbi:MAG TPA: type II toxin-antitoxin system VapC family toxin [Devosia sp.]|nr:type II toxin-antitoxin system VapC family toxin [Devosia sp.]